MFAHHPFSSLDSADVPLLLVDFADLAAGLVGVLALAAAPRVLALRAELGDFPLAVAVALVHDLLSQRLLHVWLQSQLRVLRLHIIEALLVDEAGNCRVDDIVAGARLVVAHLGGQLGAQTLVDGLFIAHCLLHTVGEHLWRLVERTLGHGATVEQPFVRHSRLFHHGLARRLQEAVGISVVDGLGAQVPACVVGVAGVAASVHFRLLHLLDVLITEAFLDVKESFASLLSDLVAGADGADCGVPGGLLGAEEVAVNIVVDYVPRLLRPLVVRVLVLLPAAEARLVPVEVDLAVSDGAHLGLGLSEVVGLGQACEAALHLADLRHS